MSDPQDRFGKMWRDLSQAEFQHSSYEQFEAYVDARLDPAAMELVRAHTDLCAQCAAELADLQQFAATLREREIASAPVSAWVRWREWFAAPRHAWMMAGAVAVLIVVASVVPRAFQPASGPVAAVPNTSSVPPAAPGTSTSPATTASTKSPNPPASSPATTTTVARPPLEAVLEVPRRGLGLKGSTGIQPTYRVLPPAEALRYRLELDNAPNDPEARAAVAIKYGLYGEAEKEYQKLIDVGGEHAAKGRRLMEALERLRHP